MKFPGFDKCFALVMALSLVMFSPNTDLEAQELRARVQVMAPGIQGTNREVFEAMQTSISEFLNEQRWGTHKFNAQERIECTFLINIKEVIGTNEFRGTLQIQARRPVFNSSYHTQLINYMDQYFHVRYIEYEPMIYNPTNIESNLIAILSYYANIILGFDYDSFSPLGGTAFFQQAEQIVNLMQNASESGWRSFDGTRNRYWLVENLLNEHHTPLRNAFYQYHRRGLDMIADKPEEARTNIASSLELLQRVHRQRPNSFALGFFFDAKTDELVNIFSESPSMEKGKVVNLLSEIDPSSSDKYQKILSGT